MHTTFAFAAIAGVAYAASAVTSDISPTGSAPAGFATSYASSFQITAVNTTVVTAKRDLSKRSACPTASGSLVITLTDGKLTDEKNRTGYIASNYQFQFDDPPQAGAIYTDGFSVGSNSSLALGSSAVFYECLSGGFYNLYDRSWAAQCEPILIDILPCGDSSSGEVTQASDGQPAATGVATATSVISQISDGQPQAASAIPITQITDGQIQVPTAVISELSDGQPQAPTTLSVVVATSTAAPITELSDGQPQAPTTAAPVSTSSASGAVISQISDGQPQAPANATSVITSTTSATNGTSVTTSTPTAVTVSGGNAVTIGSSFVAIVIGLVAALL